MSEPRDFSVLDCSLSGRHLVEASAGTGKTWNLCALFLRLLIEEARPVEQILVLTFTHAATAELRERIRSRLIACRTAWSTAADTEARDRLIRDLFNRFTALGIDRSVMLERLEHAIAHFDQAAIFTIHSFCQRALADTPFSAGQALQLTVVQDDLPLVEEVVHDYWRTEILSDRAPRPLVEFVHRQDKRPGQLIRDLRAHLARPTARILWPEPSDAGVESSPSGHDDEALRASISDMQVLWTQLHQALKAALERDRPAMYASLTKNGHLERALQAWQHWFDQADALTPLPNAERMKLLKTLSHEGYRLKKGARPSVPSELLDLGQQIVQALAAREALGESLWEALRRKALRTLPGQLQALKRARQVLGFNDMLSNLHQRLLAPDAHQFAESLRLRFPVALVDEFQDTDPLQFEIFDRLYPALRSSLFLLGDPKQSIYSFRNADLHTYLIARRSAEHQHTLRHNQRSSAALISALNHVFTRNPAAFLLEGVQYTEAALGERPREVFLDRRSLASAPHRDTLAPLTLWTLPGPDPTQILERRSAETLAANACALEIASLLHGAERDEVSLDGRRLNGADIAVLVRRREDGERMRQALLALGISSVSMTQDSVFESIDADELEQVMQAVLEPSRIDAMRIALSTDLIGETAETLLALEHDDDLLTQWSVRLHSWAQTWAKRGIGAMVRRLMREVGVVERWLSRTDGERRLTNLLHLTESLQTASREHPQARALLGYLHQARLTSQAPETSIMRLESDRALVRILTIHKSKGLEFPIVFCPFLWTERMAGASGDVGPGAHYHDDEGHPIIDQRRSADRGDEQSAIHGKIRLERAAESVRLIYVALTRAQHRLVLITGQSLGGRRDHPPERRAQEGAASVFHWMTAGQAAPLERWLTGTVDAQQVHEHWQQWIEAGPDALRCHPVPLIPSRPLSRSAGVPPESITALPPPGRLRPRWRLGSYSSLVHGVVSEHSESDRDQRARSELAFAPTAERPSDDPFGFPRGAQAGVCIHALLERVDFQQPATWPRLIDQVLGEFPPESILAKSLAQDLARGPDHAPALGPSRMPPPSLQWARQLQALLEHCLRTPLPGGFRMCDIPAAHRLNELEFTLSVPRLQVQPLQALLDTHGAGLQLPAFDSLRGYLRGFIDLVFMHEDRYYVLDWKSNHLGDSANDYHPDRLQQAIAANHYDLQSLIYCCALHRYLKQRLRHYQVERHFGGSLYLFVRGVRPGWVTPEGQACGVHLHRPSSRLLDDLDRLLGPPEVEGAWRTEQRSTA